jgi:pyridoxine kinase
VILILSSFVASSPVGGGMQARVLARMGFEPVLVPTVLYGRHPGLGAPGGGAVAPAVFASLLEGIAANGVLETAQAVLCGYFADPAQVAIAAETVDAARAASPGVTIVVDPIMGDGAGGLYVREAVAAALATELVARADLVCPNAFELERLSGQGIDDVRSAMQAARSLKRPVLASSVPVGADIGVLFADPAEAWLASHQRAGEDRKGAGDLLTALFVGHRLAGARARQALAEAVGEVAGAPVRVDPL